LSGVPDVEIAFDGGFLLFFLLLAHMFLPFLYFHQIVDAAFPLFLLQLSMGIPVLFLGMRPELPKFLPQQRQRAVELMVFLGFVFAFF